MSGGVATLTDFWMPGFPAMVLLAVLDFLMLSFFIECACLPCGDFLECQ